MSQPFYGQIIQVGFGFAPRNYAFCNGQILSIAQNTALFSLLGTTYGGNGQTTFALPNLQGRRALHPGQGPGLSNYALGQVGGVETTTLLVTQMPQHAHAADFTATSSFKGANVRATQQAPTAGAVLGRAVDGAPSPTAIPRIYLPAGTTPDVALAGLSVIGTTNVAGGSQPFAVLDPYLAINHCIALTGIYPSRN